MTTHHVGISSWPELRPEHASNHRASCSCGWTAPQVRTHLGLAQNDRMAHLDAHDNIATYRIAGDGYPTIVLQDTAHNVGDYVAVTAAEVNERHLDLALLGIGYERVGEWEDEDGGMAAQVTRVTAEDAL